MKREFIFILFFLIAVSLCGCVGPSGYDSLDAKLYCDSFELKITNENEYVWNSITVILNEKYEFFFLSLSSGDSRAISLYDFSDPNGMSFLPDFQVAKFVVIRASKPDGEVGSYSGEVTK